MNLLKLLKFYLHFYHIQTKQKLILNSKNRNYLEDNDNNIRNNNINNNSTNMNNRNYYINDINNNLNAFNNLNMEKNSFNESEQIKKIKKQ